MLPNILQGPSLLLHISFLIRGNAARCAPLKIPHIVIEDDIRVLFFHDVLSTPDTIEIKLGKVCSKLACVVEGSLSKGTSRILENLHIVCLNFGSTQFEV